MVSELGTSDGGALKRVLIMNQHIELYVIVTVGNCLDGSVRVKAWRPLGQIYTPPSVIYYNPAHVFVSKFLLPWVYSLDSSDVGHSPSNRDQRLV